MSLINAENYLKKLSQALNIQAPMLDEEKACMLNLPEGSEVHFLIEEKSEKIFIYSPLLAALPKTNEEKTALYENLLEHNMQFGKESFGQLGLDVKRDLLMFFTDFSTKENDSDGFLTHLEKFMRRMMIWKKVLSSPIQEEKSEELKQSIKI